MFLKILVHHVFDYELVFFAICKVITKIRPKCLISPISYSSSSHLLIPGSQFLAFTIFCSRTHFISKKLHPVIRLKRSAIFLVLVNKARNNLFVRLQKVVKSRTCNDRIASEASRKTC